MGVLVYGYAYGGGFMAEATIQWRYPEIVGRYAIKIGYRPALRGSIDKDDQRLEWFVSLRNAQRGITTEIQVVNEMAAIKAKKDLIAMIEG